MFQKIYHHPFFRFCLVGGGAFVIDAALLGVNHTYFGLNPLVSRIISFCVAVIYTWVFNRRFTFKVEKTDSLLSEFKRYLLVNSLALCINFSIYLTLVYSIPFMYYKPIFAVVFATGISLFFNYFSIKKYAFKTVDSKQK